MKNSMLLRRLVLVTAAAIVTACAGTGYEEIRSDTDDASVEEVVVAGNPLIASWRFRRHGCSLTS